MLDKLVNEYTEKVKGKVYLIQIYQIVEVPENAKKACDFILNILRKARKKWNIMSEDSLFNYHTKYDKEKDEVNYYYSIGRPLKIALKDRIKERYEQYKNNHIPVTKEEEELFEEIDKAIASGKEINMNKISVFYGLKRDNSDISPINMPGIPDSDDLDD